MDEKELRETRSKVITNAIAIESIIGGIICQNYFGGINQHFMLEVIYDEQFTFALKRNILKKIDPDLEKSGYYEKICKIMKIRNSFAHSNVRVVTTIDDVKQLIVLNPQDFAKGFKGHYGRGLDFDKLYSEFNKLYDEVKIYLNLLANRKGLNLEGDN